MLARVLLLVAIAITSCGHSTPPPVTTTAAAVPTPTTAAPPPPPAITPAEFAPIAELVNADIADHRLPGAVVLIGHDGQIVYRQAFGDRKLPGEPGLDGRPAPAEPMTTDTIFDLASMTKALATTTAIMQLHEQGRIEFDEPVQNYLPGFNPTGDPRRAQVTIRMLLTHTSGIGGDLSMQGPWGLNPADKAAGIHLAEVSSLEFGPGEGFHYNDINFILNMEPSGQPAHFRGQHGAGEPRQFFVGTPALHETATKDAGPERQQRKAHRVEAVAEQQIQQRGVVHRAVCAETAAHRPGPQKADLLINYLATG
mgnify:CR=1 FL=1